MYEKFWINPDKDTMIENICYSCKEKYKGPDGSIICVDCYLKELMKDVNKSIEKGWIQIPANINNADEFLMWIKSFNEKV